MSLVLLQIVNQTGYTLKLEFLKKPIYLIVIFLLLHFGLIGLLIAYVINSLWGTLVNMSAPHKYIGYSFWAQIKDIAWYIIAWTLGTLVVWGLSMMVEFGDFASIIVRSMVMVTVYLGVLWLFKDVIIIKYGHKLLMTLKNRI